MREGLSLSRARGAKGATATIPLQIPTALHRVRAVYVRDIAWRRRGSTRIRIGPEVVDVASDLSDTDSTVRQFAAGLPREERMLVVLKRELYEGSWDEMAADLEARLEGRPYIFKLANRITDDLERIRRLRAFEQQHVVDLADYVALGP